MELVFGDTMYNVFSLTLLFYQLAHVKNQKFIHMMELVKNKSACHTFVYIYKFITTI